MTRIFPHALACLLLLLPAPPLPAQQTTENIVTITDTMPESAIEEPAPPVVAPPLLERPTATPSSPRVPAAQGQVTLQYPNNPVEDLIDHFQRLTGLSIIRDSALDASGNVKLLESDPVSPEQAVELISSTLLLNGIVFVDAGPGKVKAISVAGGKNPRSEGIPLHSNIGYMPPGEVVTSFFMPLNYLSTEEAIAIFQNHIPLHAYGSIVPVPNAQALVVTENAVVIRKLAQLRELIDVPPAPIDTEFVQLERANAVRVAELVNQLLENRGENRPQSSAAAFTGEPPIPGMEGGASPIASPATTGLVAGDAQIIPDPRTNRIIVRTRPINIPYLRNLILEFDRAIELMDPSEHPLNFVAASEVLPVLVDLIAESEEDRTQATALTGQTTQTTTATGRQQEQQTGRGSSALPALERLSEPVDSIAAQSVTVGNTTLIADNRANSILVLGPPESREKVRTLLEKLDTRPLQVYLATVIGQLRLNDEETLGIDILQRFAATQDGASGVASSMINRGPLAPRPDATTLLVPGAFPAVPGLAAYGVIDNLLDVYLSALSSSNRFRVISRPAIYTTNNKRATILSGERVAVPVSTLTDTTNPNAVTSNIRFEDVVLRLEVVPLINANREVTLTIVQENNRIIGTQTVGGNDVPTIGTQQLNTTVTVPNNSTVVLGGLIITSDRRDRTGVPYLSKIPLLGYLFRQSTNSEERSELIVMIQPTVIETPDELIKASYAEQTRTEVGRSVSDTEFTDPLVAPVVYEPLPR